MSHQLPDKYWDCWTNGPFLHELFPQPVSTIAQLQTTNNDFTDPSNGCPDNIANMASQVALAVACTILTSMQMLARGQPTRNAKASNPEPFDGSWECMEQFIQSIHITVTMQLNAFTDKRMKILYTLSFMQRGMAQVWHP